MMTSLKNAVCGALLTLSLTGGSAIPAIAKSSSSQNEQIPNFVQTAYTIKNALQSQQYAKIIPYIHPKKGVRFSMYAYVDVKKDKVFSQKNFGKYLKKSKIKFTWGDKDGIGEPLITPLPSYLSNWVVRDNLPALNKVGINEFYGTGNSLNNLRKVYPTQDLLSFIMQAANSMMAWIGDVCVWYLKTIKVVLIWSPSSLMNGRFNIDICDFLIFNLKA